MKKKLLALALTLFCSFACAINFSACERGKVRENILKQLREIPSSDEYALVTRYGYSTKRDAVDFQPLVAAQLKKDGVDGHEDVGVSCEVYYDGYVLFVARYDKKCAVGYIRLEDCSTRIFYTEINEKTFYSYSANENYFVYGNPYNDVYCVLDRKTDSLTENVSDVTPYKEETQEPVYIENGVEYRISDTDRSKLLAVTDGKEELFLEFTFDYILQRSAEMQEVEKVLEQTVAGNRQSTYELMICDNELFVVRESELTMMGRGVVYPLVFKYTVETDSFVYIGCSAYHDLLAIVKTV